MRNCSSFQCDELLGTSNPFINRRSYLSGSCVSAQKIDALISRLAVVPQFRGKVDREVGEKTSRTCQSEGLGGAGRN
jgi:hypothetical protein